LEAQAAEVEKTIELSEVIQQLRPKQNKTIVQQVGIKYYIYIL
jgi:hypothetical protein